MIGVSPAYFISRFTDRFTPRDIVSALPDIKALGFDGFEPEIFHVDTITAWRNGGGADVAQAARDNGLTPTQFVAHVLVKAFDSTTSLASPLGLVEMREIVEMLDVFEDIGVIVVPFAAFKGTITKDHQARLVEKLSPILACVEASGRHMSLEIMPDSLIGGYQGFKQLCDRLESDTLGLNMDTGHGHACGEDLLKACAELGHRMYGTHLCDNYGVENLSLAPGRAEINFQGISRAMKAKGYAGSWDVEIICNPAEIRREYTAGLAHIKEALG